jgi:putative addiction module component (TIGR02574 family)
MTEIATIAKDAERLPPADRIKLVERLLETLDQHDPEIDALWADEGERRLEAYLRGDTQALDASEIIARHLKS